MKFEDLFYIPDPDRNSWNSLRKLNEIVARYGVPQRPIQGKNVYKVNIAGFKPDKTATIEAEGKFVYLELKLIAGKEFTKYEDIAKYEEDRIYTARYTIISSYDKEKDAVILKGKFLFDTPEPDIEKVKLMYENGFLYIKYEDDKTFRKETKKEIEVF